MMLVYLLMALVGAAIAIFALENSQPVTIQFLVWKAEAVSLSLVILVSLVTGIVFASLSGLVKVVKLRFRIRQLENQVGQLTGSPPPPPPDQPQAPGG